MGAADRAGDAARLARKKRTFVEECEAGLAEGKLTKEQLACAIAAESLEAGNRCMSSR